VKSLSFLAFRFIRRCRRSAPILQQNARPADRSTGQSVRATEAVGNNDRRGRGRLDRRQQAVLGDGFRDLKLIGFKAEGAGHSAAAGLDRFNCSAGLEQQGDFIGRSAEDGLVMAMAMDQYMRSREPACGEAGSFGGQPVGQQPDLLAQALGARVIGNSSSSSSLKTLAQLGSRKMNG